MLDTLSVFNLLNVVNASAPKFFSDIFQVCSCRFASLLLARIGIGSLFRLSVR